MQKSKYQQFEVLKSQGVPRLEIISRLGISKRTYDNYNNRWKSSTTKNKIPIEKYINACLFGCYTREAGFTKTIYPNELKKDDIADIVGVTKKTLIKHEKNYILKDFARWLYLHNYAPPEIARTLKVKKHGEIFDYLHGVELPEEILKQIQVLSEFIGFNPDEFELSEDISKDLKKISNIMTSIIEKIKSSIYYKKNKISAKWTVNL